MFGGVTFQEEKDKSAWCGSLRELTSFLPDPDVPSSRLAPEDREPWDSRRPLLPAKSKQNSTFFSRLPTVMCTVFMKLQDQTRSKKTILTVVKVGQLSFLRALAEAPVARPGEEHAFPPVSRVISTVLVQRSARFTLFVLLAYANRMNNII